MRAVTFRRYGPPEVLQIEELPAPAAKEKQLLIRVRAAEVTKSDCEFRGFRFAVKWFWLPLRIAYGIRSPRNPILGGYFAGEVASDPPPSSPLRKGDAVFGCAKMQLGAYAQYLRLPEHYTVVKTPSGTSFAQAAAIPLGGLNALHFLNKLNPTEAEHLLINGGGGSIGLFAIQIAKARGAIVTVVDKASKRAITERAGADHFIDYTQQDFTQEAIRYDMIFDMVVSSNLRDCLNTLKPNGRYASGNPRFADLMKSLFNRFYSNHPIYTAFAAESPAELAELKALVETGKLNPLVDSIYPMEQAAEAHRRVETEERNGAIVLEID
ncbi:NAD(P)-dependent alcohol dehydrogenase [Pelagicoccus sp. SDUM812002]|uniref:NAD(P)-dependent alcohol dehydrogenase n=1 Tax=Pelagicoccus sp. SDUM812002 TaxID=3041266 RepID=UPI00280E901F|nr:NAD(P)-dependent alcohol dehydrogenase [Pelagicoccus sp. SDUM812002]MDQ8185754.1 NAD(P)-dependent alcohol dehydrogenase [Pelagicoccus sp. SDUM812002]